MLWTDLDVAKLMKNRVGPWMDILKSLPFDGGPSVTRWVFVRTSEGITLGWLCLVGALIYRFSRYGEANVAMVGLVFSLATALFGFAALNQNTKLTVDSKPAGSPSTISTPGGTISTGTDAAK